MDEADVGDAVQGADEHRGERSGDTWGVRSWRLMNVGMRELHACVPVDVQAAVHSAVFHQAAVYPMNGRTTPLM